MEALQSNISLADLWLKGMAVGAKSSGRTVQQLGRCFTVGRTPGIACPTLMTSWPPPL